MVATKVVVRDITNLDKEADSWVINPSKEVSVKCTGRFNGLHFDRIDDSTSRKMRVFDSMGSQGRLRLDLVDNLSKVARREDLHY